jgi:hypothetical protein
LECFVVVKVRGLWEDTLFLVCRVLFHLFAGVCQKKEGHIFQVRFRILCEFNELNAFRSGDEREIKLIAKSRRRQGLDKPEELAAQAFGVCFFPDVISGVGQQNIFCIIVAALKQLPF